MSVLSLRALSCLFFFNDTPTTEIYTLSLHDALPIWRGSTASSGRSRATTPSSSCPSAGSPPARSPRRCAACSSPRSEEHTSELQSHVNLVCRLLLEKKKKKKHNTQSHTTYNCSTDTS